MPLVPPWGVQTQKEEEGEGQLDVPMRVVMYPASALFCTAVEKGNRIGISVDLGLPPGMEGGGAIRWRGRVGSRPSLHSLHSLRFASFGAVLDLWAGPLARLGGGEQTG